MLFWNSSRPIEKAPPILIVQEDHPLFDSPDDHMVECPLAHLYVIDVAGRLLSTTHVKCQYFTYVPVDMFEEGLDTAMDEPRSLVMGMIGESPSLNPAFY